MSVTTSLKAAGNSKDTRIKGGTLHVFYDHRPPRLKLKDDDASEDQLHAATTACCNCRVHGPSWSPLGFDAMFEVFHISDVCFIAYTFSCSRPISLSTYRPTVVFHSCFRHDIQTRSSISHRLDVPPVRLYGRQAGVSGFGCHRLERPASSRRICAVTRGFQTTTQDLSVFQFPPRHYHMTRVLLSPFITTVWTPVVLAITNII